MGDDLYIRWEDEGGEGEGGDEPSDPDPDE